MIFGSLFTGIGGLDLGLERAGMRCAWQVEIDPFCREVLQTHWPHAHRHDDIRTFSPRERESVDLIIGGFPCQDISRAGTKIGINGPKSSLWSEFARVLCEAQPKWVVIENVSDLVSRGLDNVLRDLASLGYNAAWQCFTACAFGAPHSRDRLYLIAHTHTDGEPTFPEYEALARVRPDARALWDRWPALPGDLRMAPRLSSRLDLARLQALGNSAMPSISEHIGRAILEIASC